MKRFKNFDVRVKSLTIKEIENTINEIKSDVEDFYANFNDAMTHEESYLVKAYIEKKQLVKVYNLCKRELSLRQNEEEKTL